MGRYCRTGVCEGAPEFWRPGGVQCVQAQPFISAVAPTGDSNQHRSADRVLE